MLRTTIATLLCVPALAFATVTVPEGRWEGVIRVPDRELRFTADFARDRGGAWAGSITMPGLSVQGAALSPIVVSETGIAFTVVNALGNATHGPATFRSQRISTERIVGEMRQAGNAAEFVMQRIGSARVEPPRRSTRVSASVEDEWVGEYELGGYPRRVTIALRNRGDAGATAEFVVVGKQTTRLPVDFVGEDGNFVRVEAQAMGVTFEGRFDPQRGEIGGAITLGPVELPLTLRRATRRPS